MKKPRSQNRNTLRFGCSQDNNHTPHPLTKDFPADKAKRPMHEALSDPHFTHELDNLPQGDPASVADARGKQRKVAKQSYVRATYSGYSALTRRVYAFESRLELDYFNFLNFDGRQSYFDVQPFSIRYLIKDKMRRYTPDFLVLFDGTTYIVEIKPLKDTLTAAFKYKAQVLTDYFAEREQVFCVLTEQDIRMGERATNLQYLLAGLRQPAPTESISAFINTLSSRSMTVREFQQALRDSGNNPDLCRKAVVHRLIQANLALPWGDVVLSW